MFQKKIPPWWKSLRFNSYGDSHRRIYCDNVEMFVKKIFEELTTGRVALIEISSRYQIDHTQYAAFKSRINLPGNGSYLEDAVLIFGVRHDSNMDIVGMIYNENAAMNLLLPYMKTMKKALRDMDTTPFHAPETFFTTHLSYTLAQILNYI